MVVVAYGLSKLYSNSKPKSTQIDEKKNSKPAIVHEKIEYAKPTISVDELGEQVKVTRVAREEYKPAKSKAKASRRPSPKRPTPALRRQPEKRKTWSAQLNGNTAPADFTHVQPILFYASQTASTAAYAEQLASVLFKNDKSVYPSLSIPVTAEDGDPEAKPKEILPVQLYDLEQIELEDYFLQIPTVKPEGSDSKAKLVYLFLLPSYDPPESSPTFPFLEHLRDIWNDFRVDTAVLQDIGGFSVFGFGDSSEWGESKKFCRDAIEVDKLMGKLTGGFKVNLGSRRLFPIGFGDMNPERAVETGIKVEASLEEWRIHMEESVRDFCRTGTLGEGASLAAASESDEEGDAEENEQTEEFIDVEDLGDAVHPQEVEDNLPPVLSVDFTKSKKKKETPEMVPKGGQTYTALTKQGYTIVGSHSGVKICRWTKSALRGRGSCYKYSFYGIRSHLCMETTPSLSCSNKCVFCWRHGTNPVGTDWRWKVDQPEDIFKGVVEGHYRKIKMMKGVPGIRADRFAEAFRIRHCALSLVGEPIFYPYINQFLHLLHSSRISSFLVCNAQHPDQLATLDHVTQLYVSIDASNKESLKKIDRPLHRDFWERFQKCLEILREARNRQRTVFRLTLVKGFNMDDEVEGYADLVEKGLPCFVEIKGVTFCGTTTAVGAGLRMDNVPWYDEVKEFVYKLSEALNKRGLEYGIAAEHAHSCCALLASNNFNINGKWHTHIDYEKFFDLLESGKEFGPLDYIGAETPEWATWGQGGFNVSSSPPLHFHIC